MLKGNFRETQFFLRFNLVKYQCERGFVSRYVIRECQRCNFVLQSALNFNLKWQLVEHVS